MKSKENDHTASVCITGDMDCLKIETIEGCLMPLFAVPCNYNADLANLVTAKAMQVYSHRAEHILNQDREIAIHGDIQPFYGSMKEPIDRLDKVKQIYYENLDIIPIRSRAPYIRYNQSAYRTVIATGFNYDGSFARNEYNVKLSLLNIYLPGVDYPGIWN